MTFDRTLVAGGFAAALVLTGAGCADFERGDRPEPRFDAAAPTAGEGGEGFAGQILPLLQSRCGGCHGSNSTIAFFLTGDANRDLAKVKAYVNTSNASASALVVRPTGGQGHQAVLASGGPEYQTLLNWIGQGAQP